jgi:hypothetical protein
MVFLLRASMWMVIHGRLGTGLLLLVQQQIIITASSEPTLASHALALVARKGERQAGFAKYHWNGSRVAQC